jgi:hypothetical protein
MWSVWEKGPWDAEKNVYSTIIMWIQLSKCLLNSFDLWCSLTMRFLCWVFCLNDLSVDQSLVLKSPAIIVYGAFYSFMSYSICFMKLSTPIYAHIFIIVISSWWIVHCINSDLLYPFWLILVSSLLCKL